MDEMLQVLGDRERKCLKKNTLLLIDVRKEPCVRRQTREAYLRRRRAKLNVGRTLLAVGPFFFCPIRWSATSTQAAVEKRATHRQ